MAQSAELGSCLGQAPPVALFQSAVKAVLGFGNLFPKGEPGLECGFMAQFRAQQGLCNFIQELFGITAPWNICFGRKEALLEAPLPGSIQLLVHALATCAHSSLGLAMCSHGAPRCILGPELWGAKLLSSSLGRELFNFRFFTAVSVFPGLDFSMFFFPRSQCHFWIAAENCSLPPRFASKPSKCLLLQTGICPKPFTTQHRVLTAPSVFSKLLMLLGWL